MALLFCSASPAFATSAEHGITDLHPIALPETINEVPNFTTDGRAARIIKAYDNSAWLYLVLVQAQPSAGANGRWDVLLVRNREGQLTEPIIDSPHTGEDWVRSVVFAHGKIDGEDSTLLVVAERRIAGPIPDPSVVAYSVFRLEHDSGAYAADIEVFRLDRSWDSTQKFCNSDFALNAEFGLPVPVYASYLLAPSGCPH